MKSDCGEFLDNNGGKPMIEKILKIFYDKVYEHHWIKLYFQHISQERIESQQLDFMISVLGGPKNYSGQFPVKAHTNMFVSEELFEVRENLLKSAFKEANASEELEKRWLKIDDSFKSKIVKSSIDDCEKHFNTDVILEFNDPYKKNVA